jgi:hypothetical protein
MDAVLSGRLPAHVSATGELRELLLRHALDRERLLFHLQRICAVELWQQ